MSKMELYTNVTRLRYMYIPVLMVCCILLSNANEVLQDQQEESQFCRDQAHGFQLFQGYQDVGVQHVGHELRLACRCNPGNSGCSAEALVFDFRHYGSGRHIVQGDSTKYITNSTVELRIRHLEFKNAGIYRCCSVQCGKPENIIQSWSVRVAAPPFDPYCVFKGTAVLSCQWQHNLTGFEWKPTYFAYYAASRARGNREPWVRQWLKATKEDHLTESKFEARFEHRFSASRNFFVKLCVHLGYAGCTCGLKRLGRLSQHLRPDTVEHFTVKSTSTTKAFLAFSDPDGVVTNDSKYRVNYTWPVRLIGDQLITNQSTAYFYPPKWCKHITSRHKFCPTLDNLQPYTNYTITVEVRPFINHTYGGEWGIPTTPETFTTNMDVPQSSPRSDVGMFCRQQCPEDSGSECLTIHWEPIPQSEHGGTGVRYVVHVAGKSPQDFLIEANTTGLRYTFAIPEGTLDEAFPLSVSISTMNDVGISQEPTVVEIAQNGPPKPRNVKAITLDPKEVEVKWEGLPNVNYTVFWCVQGTGSTCAPAAAGVLHSEPVIAGANTKVLHLTQALAHSYAVAALSYDASGGLTSSGMIWSDMDPQTTSGTTKSIDWRVIITLSIIISVIFIVIAGIVIAIRCVEFINRETLDTQRLNIVLPSLPSSYEEEKKLLARVDGDDLGYMDAWHLTKGPVQPPPTPERERTTSDSNLQEVLELPPPEDTTSSLHTLTSLEPSASHDGEEREEPANVDESEHSPSDLTPSMDKADGDDEIAREAISDCSNLDEVHVETYSDSHSYFEGLV